MDVWGGNSNGYSLRVVGASVGGGGTVPATWLPVRLLLAGDIETMTFGYLPREWCLCWSCGRDTWQGCSKIIGLSDGSTVTRRRGRSTTTTCVGGGGYLVFNVCSDFPYLIEQIIYDSPISIRCH